MVQIRGDPRPGDTTDAQVFTGHFESGPQVFRRVTQGRRAHGQPHKGSHRYYKTSHIFRTFRDLKGAFFSISGLFLRRAFSQQKIENIIETPSSGVKNMSGRHSIEEAWLYFRLTKDAMPACTPGKTTGAFERLPGLNRGKAHAELVFHGFFQGEIPLLVG